MDRTAVKLNILQCYFCWNYYPRKERYDCHIEKCAGRPGYVYNFNTEIQHFHTEENLKYKGDIPLVGYIDFETTAPTDVSWSWKQKFVCFVCCHFCFPFLQINHVIIEHSFDHSIQKLNKLSFLTRGELAFFTREQMQQLKDCARTIF